MHPIIFSLSLFGAAIDEVQASSENLRTQNETMGDTAADAKLYSDAVRRRDGARAQCEAGAEGAFRFQCISSRSSARVSPNRLSLSLPLPPSPPAADLAAAMRASELETEEQARSIAFYRRLGLRFDCLEGEQLLLTFTQIDRADVEREFAIAVVVDDGDVYRVTTCTPAVSGLDALLAELNATNNFSQFVQAMRCSFIAIAETGEPIAEEVEEAEPVAVVEDVEEDA
jgi:hypothetical protein